MKKLKELREKRATLLREAEGLKVNGEFKDDQTRAAFDAKMTEIETIDGQIRAAEAEEEPAPAVVDQATRQQIIKDERARVQGIQDAVRLAKLPDTFATELVNAGKTVVEARAAIFEKLAAQSNENPTRNQVAVIGEDAEDKRARGMMHWLLVRSGMAALVAKHTGEKPESIDPGEFRGLSLLDMARESLERRGIKTRGMDRMAIAGQALAMRANYQTTSDFATLLENTLHKVLRAAYGITPDTWTRFCGTATVVDFRTHNWYRTGALTVLDSLNEVGEFKSKKIPDGEKATFSASTKGNIIAISRQTIVNDDLGFVMRLTEALGRAGKLTIEKAVYALLAQNSGLGPTLADGNTLFHANHNNISTGAALSAAAIDADRVLMAQQLDPNGQDYIDMRPAVLVIGVGLGGQAKVINQSQYDPDTVANKSQMKPNIVAGLFRDIVDSPRVTAISATRRYLFADPSFAPAIVVSFLEGQQEPVLETQDGWRTDGVEMKARLDHGVDAVDYRPALTNAGV